MNNHWYAEGLELLKLLKKRKKDENNTNNIFSSQGKRDSNDLSRSTESDR
jgi:hypothetical protein